MKYLDISFNYCSLGLTDHVDYITNKAPSFLTLFPLTGTQAINKGYPCISVRKGLAAIIIMTAANLNSSR